MGSKFLSFTVIALALAASVAAAATVPPRARYRILLRDGSSVLSTERPRPMGSVVVFRTYPGGVLTSVPAEDVAQVRTNLAQSAAASPAAPLRPGEVVVLGETAPVGAAPAAAETSVVASRPYIPGGVYDPRNPYFGYGGGRNPATMRVLTPPGVTTLPTPGDTARAISGEPPNLEPQVGPNGFPATAGTAAPRIGPDGRPILAPAGAPGSTPPVIGPNGTPVLAPSGAPGSTPPTIGPNGTPVLAPSTPPVIGPNGTPVLAPPGSPGAIAPTTGSNGFPASR